MEEVENKQKLFMSLFSGQIYTIDETQTANLDEGQIPLLDYPKENCRKCYGRGYIDKNLTTGFYTICTCMKTRINFSKFDRFKKI